MSAETSDKKPLGGSAPLLLAGRIATGRRFALTTTAALLLIAASLAGCGGDQNSASGGGKSGTPKNSGGTAAAGPSSEKTGAPQRRDAIVVGVPRDAKTLDTGMAEDFESGQINELIYETLIRFKRDNLELEPCLAERWEVSPDGKTWTFHLRQGVKFHDGSTMDADAVISSFERQLYPDHPHHRLGKMPYAEAFYLSLLDYDALDETSYNTQVLQTAATAQPASPKRYWHLMDSPKGGKEYRHYKIETDPDGQTVTFRLKDPFVSFGANLATDASSIVSTAALNKHGQDFEARPSGTGSYMLKSWTKDAQIELAAFPDYWGEKAQTPTLRFRVYEEALQRFNALKLDDAQLITSVDPKYIPELENDPNLTLYREPALSIGYLEINHVKAPFSSRKFRQALNYAIDKEHLVDIQMSGVGYVSVGALPPAMEGALKEPVYPYNPEKARQLLHESGVDLEKFVLEFKTYDSTRPYNPIGQLLAQVCKQDLESVGLKVKLDVVDFTTYLDHRNAGNFMIGHIGWGSDNGQADNTIYELFGKRDNRNRYRNPEAVKTMEAAMIEQDPAKRDELYRKANQSIVDDAAAVWLNHGMQMVAARKSVGGFDLHPKGTHKFEYVFDER
jgi:peptide/nickel transport system substrate-binding protein